VKEVASLPVLARGLDGLEDLPVEANGVTACSERNPEQVYGRGRRSLNGDGVSPSRARRCYALR
jgi:hypothetical protein